jgi:hypothetical protein
VLFLMLRCFGKQRAKRRCEDQRIGHRCRQRDD